jgi:hypothetical protein
MRGCRRHAPIVRPGRFAAESRVLPGGNKRLTGGTTPRCVEEHQQVRRPQLDHDQRRAAARSRSARRHPDQARRLLRTLLAISAVAGVGGGNFASSMANINAFYPQRLKGWALGVNAGGGNLGVAVVQLVGLAVLALAGAGHPRLVAGVYVPLIALAALGAWLGMDNLTGIRCSAGSATARRTG